MVPDLSIGTCSWKYDSWQGMIYPPKKPFNFLKEYSTHYSTVEVDQWFWSLFDNDRAVLPRTAVVREYAESVPEDFTFCIKVPNAITLTHHYQKRKGDALVSNKHFLSAALMEKFLEKLEPIADNIGPLIFQFEYLNRSKMSGLQRFVDLFGNFVARLPKEYDYGVEIRNPNYLRSEYFDFLASVDVAHVFLQGYYMPAIFDLYAKFRSRIHRLSIIRLLGPDRKEIEKRTGKNWSRIVAPKDDDLAAVASMVVDLQARAVKPFVLVNNHFEGSAPRTIARLEQRLATLLT